MNTGKNCVFEIIIVGAGAAGLVAAEIAARNGKKVVLIDGNSIPGQKIKISGGGRCNFTNRSSSPDNFITSTPNTLKNLFPSYLPKAFIRRVETSGISYHEKKLGQLFCDGSSQQIIDMLVSGCRKGGVTFKFGEKAGKLHVLDSGVFKLHLEKEQLEAPAVVVATGGLSFKKLGATDWGYQVARQFGHQLVETQPALVPLTFADSDLKKYGGLSGLSFPASVRCGKIIFDEDLLITHRGLSGPAILQISSYWNKGKTIEINCYPEADIEKTIKKHLRRDGKKELKTFLSQRMPKRFVEAHLPNELWSKKLFELKEPDFIDLAQLIHAWNVRPSGTEGYKKAEVTSGGVSLDDLDPNTLESKLQKGLYFCGEVLDVTGHLGGHNFQWAWLSGVVVGNSL